MIEPDQIPEGKSPIYFCDIDYQIFVKKKPFNFDVKGIVVKGDTLQDIKSSERVKKSVLKRHFEGFSTVAKKVANFDMSRIRIRKIHIRHSMGFGIKE